MDTIYKLVLLSHFLLTCALAYEKFHPSRCIRDTDEVIKMVTSYMGCVEFCNKRSACTGISYRRLHGACTLHDQNDVVASLERCPGLVYSRKLDWILQPDEDVCMCPLHQECDNDGECIPNECPAVTAVAHGRVQSDNFRIGSTITARCFPGYILNGSELLTCLGTRWWSDGIPVCDEDPNCVEYMVGLSAAEGVDDSQLSASSYWCDTYTNTHWLNPDCVAPKYARLNATGWLTGAWVPSTQDEKQWIQVDFKEPRVISGIALKGRDPYYQQWVTSFKVLVSRTYSYWTTIIDETGLQLVFDGTSGPDILVERHLPERVVARCVRINPVTWFGYIALRFDVLGCTPAPECPVVTSLTHGRVLGNDFLIGGTIRASCLPGYILNGPEQRTCLETGQWSDGIPVCDEDPNCMQYMVGLSAAEGVADSQLSASSYWCDTGSYNHLSNPDCLAPRYARLNATGWETGAWAPNTQDAQQWIQVDFNEPRVIYGIVLKGRDPARDQHWVTGFRVSVSPDCGVWSSIVDDGGNPVVFDGTSGPDILVERNLPERVAARCVRVNPVTWFDHIALRFDVLGCSV